MPLFDRVLVQKAEVVTKTASGILIPEKSQAKVLTGKVVAVGEGMRTEVSARNEGGKEGWCCEVFPIHRIWKREIILIVLYVRYCSVQCVIFQQSR